MTKRIRTVIDPRLAEYATPVELGYLEATNEMGSMGRAAKAAGVAKHTVKAAMKRLKVRAALRGYSPENDMTRPVPDGLAVKRISTNYGPNGEVKQQWVIGEPDKERMEELYAAMITTLSEPVKGLSPKVVAPKVYDRDLLAVFPIGDPHFGMQAWAAESGDDFDLATARRLTLGAADRLLAAAPVTETAIILLLGDTFHMDDQRNVTPGHGHQLDAAGRFAQVVEVAIETYRHMILRALQKHKKVTVRIQRGNHDPNAHLALALTLKAYFSNQPRVTVDTSPAEFWFYRFGKVLLGSAHGDKVKHDRLPLVMACDRAADWGDTEYRYWYTGHVHSTHVTEYPGVMCESFRTLAAKDAYAAGSGYRAGRDMVCIVHHRDFGEVERHRCDIGQLRAAA